MTQRPFEPGGSQFGPIVVAIPTFRRPRQLAQLMQGLLAAHGDLIDLLIVGDNDGCAEVRDLVESFAARARALRYVAVGERGVAQVRNALIEEASRQLPGWTWIVMLDDDGLVTEGWLAALLATGECLQAHLVGGPVEGALPDGASALARNSIFSSRRRWPTGLVPTLNTTQNLAISRRLLSLLEPPLFRAEYGASGGEDYDLFRRTSRRGGRLAWCDEAVVIEPAPPERLTAAALLRRYYTTGMYMAPIDRGYDGVARGVATMIKGMLRSGLEILGGVARADADLAARGVLGSAHYLGRASGLMGGSSSRYVNRKAAP